MPTTRASGNRFKAALASGRPIIGLWVACADPYLALVAGGAGFDWLVVDGEHGPNDVRSILGQLIALEASDAAVVVRAPMGEPWLIKQLLDIGADTLLVPMVDDAQQAAALVRAVRYPPAGIRGVGAGVARASGFGRDAGYLARADDEVCLIVQAESRAALENLSEIAAVDGVDAVFIGPADLAADMGQPVASDPVQDAIAAGIATIRAAGKPAGIMTPDESLNRRYLDLGAQFVAVGADTLVYASALDALARRYGLGGPDAQPATY